jgi:hypothetical protein
MKIREATLRDTEALVELHRSGGADFVLPAFDSSLFVSKWLLTTDTGVPAQAILGRLTLESYFLLDRTIGTPQQRWNWFQQLSEAAQSHGRRLGLEDVHAWINPKCRSFGRRLLQTGWEKPERISYSLQLRGSNG